MNLSSPVDIITAAQCHVCRTICRRTERLVVALAEQETIPNYTIKYLNRLSDYFLSWRVGVITSITGLNQMAKG